MAEAADVPISQWNKNVPIASQCLPCVSFELFVDPEGVAHCAFWSSTFWVLVWFYFVLLRQGLPMWPRLAWNSPSSFSFLITGVSHHAWSHFWLCWGEKALPSLQNLFPWAGERVELWEELASLLSDTAWFSESVSRLAFLLTVEKETTRSPLQHGPCPLFSPAWVLPLSLWTSLPTPSSVSSSV